MGELRAACWRNVDFARAVVRVRESYFNGETTTPKSGKVRSVLLVSAAAEQLARLDRARRSHDDSAPVFCEPEGRHRSDGRLRWRYGKALDHAGLRPLPFHDLRHTFGSLAITNEINGGEANGLSSVGSMVPSPGLEGADAAATSGAEVGRSRRGCHGPAPSQTSPQVSCWCR
jgi:integrase